MSFVANQPNPAPQTLQNLPTLAADHGLFPDIDMNRLRQSIRIDGTVTPERLQLAARAAQQQLGRELQPLHALGLASLWQLNPHQRDVVIAEKPAYSPSEELYFRAICCLTSAELTDRYRSFDSSSEGDRRANVLEETIGNLRRDARWAIRDLLGLPRSTVELI